MEKRYTRRNPNGSYRIPAEGLGEFRIIQHGISIALHGDLVDKLGEYESLLSLREARAYAVKRKQ